MNDSGENAGEYARKINAVRAYTGESMGQVDEAELILLDDGSISRREPK